MSKKKRNVIIILLIIAVGLVVVYQTEIINRLLNPEMGFIEVAEINLEPNAQVKTTDNGIFIATGNSIRFVDTYGYPSFQDIFSVPSARLVVSGEYALIIENRGFVARVYDANGLVYSVSTSHPIHTFALSQSGFLGLITQSGNIYNILVYNNNGVLHKSGQHADSNIIPTAMAISNDSSILAIAHLDINGVALNSIVQFFYMDERQALQANIEGPFAASLNNPDRIIAYLQFNNQNNLVTLSNNYISLINPEAGASTLWETSINHRLLNAHLQNNWLALLTNQGITAYNMMGENIIQKDLQANLSSGFNNALIIEESGLFKAINVFSGATLWEITVLGHNAEVLFVGDTSTIVTISGNNLRILRRVRI